MVSQVRIASHHHQPKTVRLALLSYLVTYDMNRLMRLTEQWKQLCLALIGEGKIYFIPYLPPMRTLTPSDRMITYSSPSCGFRCLRT